MVPKHLLCATDLLATGKHATDAALRLGRDFGASVCLIHSADVNVLKDYSSSPKFSRIARDVMLRRIEQRVETDRAALEAEITRLQQAGIDVSGTLHDGRPWEAIVEGASGDVDLVIVGQHAPSEGKPAALGTTAARVVRHCDKPVLVTSHSAPETWKGAKFLVGVDFSEDSRTASKLASEWASYLGGSVTIAQAMPDPSPGDAVPGAPAELQDTVAQAAKAELERWRSDFGADDARVLFGPPAQALTQCVANEDFNLLVLGTRGHSRLGALILGSTTERCLTRSPVPVLVV